MKKLLYTFIGASLMLLGTTSCEDFLETSSPSDATPEFVFSDATTARAALMEAYEKWQRQSLCTCQRIILRSSYRWFRLRTPS